MRKAPATRFQIDLLSAAARLANTVGNGADLVARNMANAPIIELGPLRNGVSAAQLYASRSQTFRGRRGRRRGVSTASHNNIDAEVVMEEGPTSASDLVSGSPLTSRGSQRSAHRPALAQGGQPLVGDRPSSSPVEDDPAITRAESASIASTVPPGQPTVRIILCISCKMLPDAVRPSGYPERLMLCSLDLFSGAHFRYYGYGQPRRPAPPLEVRAPCARVWRVACGVSGKALMQTCVEVSTTTTSRTPDEPPQPQGAREAWLRGSRSAADALPWVPLLSLLPPAQCTTG